MKNKWNKDCVMCQNLGFACEFHLKHTPTQHICCDGECNHDDCCGKVTENCPNYYKETNRPDLHPAPIQPEWMKGLIEEYLVFCEKENIKTGYNQKLETTIVSDWWLNKFSTTIQKEIERERLSVVKEIEAIDISKITYGAFRRKIINLLK